MANVAKVNGVAAASIAKVNGVSSIAKVNGLTLTSFTFNDVYYVELDGTNEAVRYLNTGGAGCASYSETDAFTLSSWLYAHSGNVLFFGNVKQVGGFWQGIQIGLAPYLNNGGPLFRLRGSDSGAAKDLRVSFHNTNHDDFNVLYEHQWVHLLFTYDGSETVAGVRCWRNGVELHGHDNGSTWTAGATISVSDNYVYVGFNGSAGYWVGGIDDIALMSGDQSASAATFYNSGARYNFSTWAGWSTMKADPKAFWIDWEAADMTATTGSVIDRTDNAYTFVPQNTENTDKVAH